MKHKKLPVSGIDERILFRQMTEAKENDVDWRKGKIWGLVYSAGDQHTELLKKAYTLYFNENGLVPAAFPSLKKLEAEVVSMLITLLCGGEEASGTMTSGGTESILLAVKAYRDYFKIHRQTNTAPEMIVPTTAHPAFSKAAQYFNVKEVRVPVGDDYRADVNKIRRKCNDKTILIVASAPSYPQGVVDHIRSIGEITGNLEIGLHVDACLGGFVLPFLKKLDYKSPDFDFSVPGVTSISADLHKYGYAAKGASAILYRDPELRRSQFYVTSKWPGGLFASPTMLGTRPGGTIAAAWAALMSLGENGYLNIVQKTMAGTKKLLIGLQSTEGIKIVGSPDMTILSFTSEEFDIFSIAESMEALGWRVNRQTNPDSLHMIVTLRHLEHIDTFLNDIKLSVKKVGNAAPLISKKRKAVLYGDVDDVNLNQNEITYLLKMIERNYLL